MATIRSLRVQHVRTHHNYTFTIAPDVTVITGANGSGKTTLLEAIHIALLGTSFKGTDKDILERGESWYRIDLGLSDSTERIVKFDIDRHSGRKQFVIDGKTHYRMPSGQRLAVVLFEPDDLRLLHGSPERRRRFIDHFISQVDPTYATALRRYERALKQRNALLKRRGADADYFAWNVTLSEYGATIIEQRQYFIHELNQQLNKTYEAIARQKDMVLVRYTLPQSNNSKQKLLSELHHTMERDLLLGFTTVGPHRHDIIFEFNQSPALSVASRGEVRSIVLALKFLEIDIIERITKVKPIVLLDDVFSELDETRQQHLTTFTKSHQVIITSATSSNRIKASYITKL